MTVRNTHELDRMEIRRRVFNADDLPAGRDGGRQTGCAITRDPDNEIGPRSGGPGVGCGHNREGSKHSFQYVTASLILARRANRAHKGVAPRFEIECCVRRARWEREARPAEVLCPGAEGASPECLHQVAERFSLLQTKDPELVEAVRVIPILPHE